MVYVNLYKTDGYITPPIRLIDWRFANQVWNGEKKLPKAIGPESISNLKRVPELSAQLLWSVLGGRPDIAAYFPTILDRDRYKVQRSYFFSVIRWKRPGLITRLVMLSQKRKNGGGALIEASIQGDEPVNPYEDAFRRNPGRRGRATGLRGVNYMIDPARRLILRRQRAALRGVGNGLNLAQRRAARLQLLRGRIRAAYRCIII